MNSYWLASTESTCFPSLEEDIKVDIAIVGGGLSGISCAWQLCKEGFRIAVLESGRIGMGATARTTAKVTSQHNLIYQRLLTQKGSEIAMEYAEANETAIKEMRSIANQLSISCDFQEQSAYVYTQQDKYRVQIEQEVAAAEHLGIKASFQETIPLPLPIKASVRFDAQAQFHPRKYLLGLAAELRRRDVSIFEKTQAIDLEELPNGHLIITNLGKRVMASKVILASHYPFYNKQSMYYTRIYTERDYVVAIKASEPFPGGMYITAEDPTRSMRSLRTADGDLILVVGDQHKTGQGGPTTSHYNALQSDAEKLFTVQEVPYRWSTQDCMTLDGLPYVGRYTDRTTNLYVATGFGKWGMTNSTAASMILRDLIVTGRSAWQEAYHPSRKTILSSAMTFLKENLNVAEQLVEGKLSGDETSSLEPGEGKILFDQGERLGVFLGMDGSLHVVNAACTHMGCGLNWNQAEHSWDCPCHGSRFSVDGEVLEGPAVNALKVGENTSTIKRLLFEKF